MATEVSEEKIGAVRQFNRFFTRQIGVLREGLLHSPTPLPKLAFSLSLDTGTI